MYREKLIAILKEWIGEEVPDGQIHKVLWGLAFLQDDGAVTQTLKSMRAEAPEDYYEGCAMGFAHRVSVRAD